MKKHKYIIVMVCIFCTTLFAACEDLDPKLPGKLGGGSYPKNQEDIKTLVTGIYGNLNTGTYGGGLAGVAWKSRLIVNTATTDEFDCSWRNSVWSTYRYFRWISSEEHVTKIFSEYQKVISECINAMYYMDQVNMDDKLKSRYKAELKAIMALYAYTLYDYYGPIGIVTDPEITLNSSSTYIPERPTKEAMVEFITNTAREAIRGLPDRYDAKDNERMTKGAVLMVLLKLAMHEKDWNNAVAVSKEIMDLGVYTLQPRYISIFAVDNEMNKEIIFATPNSVEGSRYNSWLAHVLPDPYVEPNGISVQKWGGYKVPWDMYEKYWDKTGKPVYSPINDQRLESIWGSINTAKGIVFLRDSIKAPNWSSWVPDGAIPYKYPADPNAIGEPHGNDIVVYRYADVLLLRAEALNNLQPVSAEAISLINEVRGRAKTTLISQSDFSNGQALNDFILDERFRELFMEGHRREDLIRHGKYLTEARRRGATFYDETRLLFPIPQFAVNQMGGRGQNPGY